MSTPKGKKNLWKRIDWEDKEEKEAFFNKYFNGGELVKREINRELDSLKLSLTSFVENGEIREGNKTRSITNEDIIKKINELR